MNKTKQHSRTSIGKVSMTYLSEPSEVHYFDGAESQLYDIFSSREPTKKRDAVLNKNPSWPMVYHLSNKRSTLVDWFNFRQDSAILEIGAGCGAITEALVRKPVQVTALEIDPMRAKVNAERNKNSSNLSIVVGNIDDYKPDYKFDYVVCVGVLEYSGKYVPGKDPYMTFAKKMKQFLKPGGIALIAIENKLGLKYLAGAREDHTGGLFDSVNNYPNSIGIRTFSHNELRGLLTQAGLTYQTFYYPHPDYKLPHSVFSDSFSPGKDVEFPLGLLPTSTPEPRRHFFSEQALMTSLEHENLYGFFANSFLVLSSDKPVQLNNSPAAYIGQRDRKPEFEISTTFHETHQEGFVVRKQAANKAASGHVLTMVDTSRKLKRLGVQHVSPSSYSKSKAEELAYIEYPLVKGITLERALIESLMENKIEEGKDLLEKALAVISKLPSKHINPSSDALFRKTFGDHFKAEQICVKPGVIDLNLDNFILQADQSVTLFDYEWIFDCYVPRNFIVGRLLLSFFGTKFADLLRRNHEKLQLVEVYDNIVIPKDFLKIPLLKNIDYRSCLAANLAFQEHVSRISPRTNIPGNVAKPKPVTSYQSFGTHLDQLEATVTHLHDTIHQLTKDIEHYKGRLEQYDKHPVVRGLKRTKVLPKI